ncbi:MAG TPA: hypothetical protein VFT19_11240 [Solirubrobacterales bacterium]|nr:hypothetical protein [Solirubrobacterales bacterium]
MRAGAKTVRMLSDPLQVQIIRVMAGGFNALSVPEGYTGEEGPRRRLPRRPEPEPRGPEGELHDHDKKYAITPTGLARVPVAGAIELWLLKASGGAISYSDSDPRAEPAIELLADAWGSGLAHAIAAGPADRQELIAGCEWSPRSAKRLLARLRRAGMVEAATTPAGAPAHAATEWLRRGIGPLAFAARVERSDPPEEAKPVDALDVEAAMLLVAPLLRLDEDLSGACRLAVRLGEPGQRQPVGVTLRVGEGRVLSCERGLDPDAGAEAVGELAPWFTALIDRRTKRLRFDGDRRLARAVVAEFSRALFDEAAYAH